jgi:hypothetical protein
MKNIKTGKGSKNDLNQLKAEHHLLKTVNDYNDQYGKKHGNFLALSPRMKKELEKELG